MLASIAAAVFISKVVQVRNSWTSKALASKKKYVELVPKIEQLETQIDSLKGELFRSRELWGRAWLAVPTEIQNAADGTLTLSIGTDQGIRDKQLLHGCEVMQDGSAIYRGAFSVAAIQNNAASVKPNWRATPEEIRQWQPGSWRWRNTIPVGYQETFERQLLTTVKHEETLKARMATLAGQKDLLAKANDGLKQREAELLGGELLGKPEKVEPEYREGLVAAIEKEEEARNAVLRTIDELRRKVRKTQADIELLQAENVDLVNRLPEASRREEVTQKVK
jgi:hypothetical protein